MALKILIPILLISLVPADEVKVVESERSIVISRGETDILTYHKAEVPPPKGAKEVYRRSGFIHPLKSPKGGVVTGTHPDDHLHHLGLWHAWVKTKHGKDQPDFWNLGTGSGRVRFSKVLSRVANGFTVEQEQIAYKGAGKVETVVLTESLTILVSATKEGNFIDYHLIQKNVSDNPLELPAYRYGGPLAYRGPHSWNKENSDYLTSAGKKRADSHATRADWCAIFGPTDQGDATITMMGHPDNFDAPQRLRTWPDGKIFLCWTPIQEKSLVIQPKKSVTWKYRIVISDGKPEQAATKLWWTDYRSE